MISVINNEIISIRESFEKKINSIISFERINKGKIVDFVYNDDSIDLVIEKSIISRIKYGVIFDLIKDVLSSERYKYKCSITDFNIEDDFIKVKIEIFRKIDLDNDPYVRTTDFTLIKTTKKDDGISRQDSYSYTKVMDFLKFYSSDGSIYIGNNKNQILGELGSKGIAFIEEHKGANLFCRLLEKKRNDSYNYVGVVRIYEVVR